MMLCGGKGFRAHTLGMEEEGRRGHRAPGAAEDSSRKKVLFELASVTSRQRWRWGGGGHFRKEGVSKGPEARNAIQASDCRLSNGRGQILLSCCRHSPCTAC